MRILDVGSGKHLDDPSAVFPGAIVYAIDPEFGPGGRLDYHSADETIMGIVQDLPCPDSSFDFVISSHAVPQHIFPVDMPIAIEEMTRVLKHGGEVRLVPCVPADIDADSRAILVQAGYTVVYEEGPDGPIAIIKER